VYPLDLAAPIALKTIIEFLRQGAHDLDEVRVVLYPRGDDRAYPVFKAALEQILAEQPGGYGA
jgi:O-acetyl-ADP-ribose deacetylase (regulator of RNase III)